MGFQIRPGDGIGDFRNVFWCAPGHNVAAGFPAAGSQVDDAIGQPLNCTIRQGIL